MVVELRVRSIASRMRFTASGGLVFDSFLSSVLVSTFPCLSMLLISAPARSLNTGALPLMLPVPRSRVFHVSGGATCDPRTSDPRTSEVAYALWPSRSASLARARNIHCVPSVLGALHACSTCECVCAIRYPLAMHIHMYVRIYVCMYVCMNIMIITITITITIIVIEEVYL